MFYKNLITEKIKKDFYEFCKKFIKENGIIYMGIVPNSYFPRKISNFNKKLHPQHITLAYGENEMLELLFSKYQLNGEIQFDIVGYGTTATNEALAVEIYRNHHGTQSSVNPIGFIKEKGRVPFITLGVAPNGKPKDSEKITFKRREDYSKNWKKRLSSGETIDIDFPWSAQGKIFGFTVEGEKISLEIIEKCQRAFYDSEEEIDAREKIAKEKEKEEEINNLQWSMSLNREKIEGLCFQIDELEKNIEEYSSNKEEYLFENLEKRGEIKYLIAWDLSDPQEYGVSEYENYERREDAETALSFYRNEIKKGYYDGITDPETVFIHEYSKNEYFSSEEKIAEAIEILEKEIKKAKDKISLLKEENVMLEEKIKIIKEEIKLI